MKIAVILNSSRATPEILEQLRTHHLEEKFDISYDVFIKEGNEIALFIRELSHQTYNTYIIGGGDGTVRTVAEAVAGLNIPLIILPLGTFNFLAKELNYPNDLEALFAMIKNNKQKLVDVGEVNGHIFINHAWVGFYSEILKLRKKYTSVLKKSRLLKIIFNTFNFFKSITFYQLEIAKDNTKICYRTCLMYIGNNDHYTNLLDFGEKKSLSSGLLSVSILNCQTRWQLCKCAISILFNNFKDSQYITQFMTDHLTITSKEKFITLVLDGEIIKTEIPLNFTIHKKKLTVVVP